MSLRDPRLQLYSAADENLERLHHDFLQSPYTKNYKWTDFFTMLANKELRFPFADPESSFEADSAAFTSIHRSSSTGEVVFSLNLFRDKSLYCREQDYDTFSENGHYDVVTGFEAPPVILVAGIYDKLDTKQDRLMQHVTDGTAEVLGLQRASALASMLPEMQIEFIDLSAYDQV